MFASLAFILDVARPYVPPALVSPTAWEKLRPVAQSLPVWLTRSILFECRLKESDRVDLSVALERPEATRFLGANRCPASAERLRQAPGWDQVDSFVDAWRSADSQVYDTVTGMCLEFDVPTDPRAANGIESLVPPVPAVFARIRSSDRSSCAGRSAHRRDVMATLRALMPSLEASVRSGVRRMLTYMPTHGSISWLASMLSRNDSRARVCVHGLTPREIGSLLEALEWDGVGSGVLDCLGEFQVLNLDVTLSLDIGATVGERIGLECRVPEAASPKASRPTARPPYGTLIGVLERNGWCHPKKAKAARAWHRAHRTTGLEADEAALFLRCELVKVVLHPDGCAHAKLYPGLRHADLDGPADAPVHASSTTVTMPPDAHVG